MRLRFYLDPETGLPQIYNLDVTDEELEEGLLRPTTQEKKMKKSEFPPGWDEERVRDVIDFYENQTDEEAAREHEAALTSQESTFMEVPHDLVPSVREMIAKHRLEKGADR